MNGEEPMTLMMLPNDLVLNCLAHVSRLYYPILSLVSQIPPHNNGSLSAVHQIAPRKFWSQSHLPILLLRTSQIFSNIYAIGGLFIKDDNASSSIMVMDRRSHTWHEAPSMPVARVSPSACILDGKIYVIGGCN
ncbi:hypothetical protein ARALYDRAFT_899674 [Arabidopsis lyrata subsp. lyrata]|uniref:FKB95-like N-terminal Kelch domain-containing protein n=1 Tax=Arabidopsis lyrata subsp. lyrata TaxID=81972 RepID=D7L2N1_ARALL|nr:hypothetical protein ARALYDRAFT_899674 [Arabidopsis lyrata subsp. lyrata]